MSLDFSVSSIRNSNYPLLGSQTLLRRRGLPTGCLMLGTGQYPEIGTGAHPYPCGSVTMERRLYVWVP